MPDTGRGWRLAALGARRLGSIPPTHPSTPARLHRPRFPFHTGQGRVARTCPTHTTTTMTTTIETAVVVVTYAAFGAVYGTAGYVHAVTDGNREFDLQKFASTIAIAAAAGIVVALQTGGDGFKPGQFEAVMAALIPIADQFLNARIDGDGGGDGDGGLELTEVQ